MSGLKRPAVEAEASSKKAKGMNVAETKDGRLPKKMQEVAEHNLNIEHLECENRKLKADAAARFPRGIIKDDREIAFFEASKGGLIRTWSDLLIETARKVPGRTDWWKASDLSSENSKNFNFPKTFPVY